MPKNLPNYCWSQTASLPKRVTNNIFRAPNFASKKNKIIKSGNYWAKCPFKGYTVPKFDTQKVRRKNRKIKLNNTISPVAQQTFNKQ